MFLLVLKKEKYSYFRMRPKVMKNKQHNELTNISLLRTGKTTYFQIKRECIQISRPIS